MTTSLKVQVWMTSPSHISPILKTKIWISTRQNSPITNCPRRELQDRSQGLKVSILINQTRWWVVLTYLYSYTAAPAAKDSESDSESASESDSESDSSSQRSGSESEHSNSQPQRLSTPPQHSPSTSVVQETAQQGVASEMDLSPSPGKFI